MSQIKIKSALHSAVNALPSMMTTSVILTFDGRLVTTVDPHGLMTGMVVKITDSSFDGSYNVNVVSATTFTLRSTTNGSSVVKTAGNGGSIVPQLTAWPNVKFDPVTDAPYQKVNVVFAKPQEPTAGSDFYQEVGFLQVTLYYPLLQGDGPALSRAELIRKAFPKGSSVTKDDVTVQFNSVAQILEGVPSDDSYVVIVRVPFYANIYT